MTLYPCRDLGGTLAFAKVRIQLCGRLAVEDGGARVEGRLPGRQGRLLLAYLVANWDRAVTRDELCFAVWGDDLPPDADNGLSALISKLRRAVGPARVDGRSELRFVADDETFVDMHLAIEALHRAEAHVAGGRCRTAGSRGTRRSRWPGATSSSVTTPRGWTSGGTGCRRWRPVRSSATSGATWARASATPWRGSAPPGCSSSGV